MSIIFLRKEIRLKRIFTLSAVLMVTLFGCTSPEWDNFVAVMDGTVDVYVINETPYSVTTHFGLYNPLDAKNNVNVKSVTLTADDPSKGFTSNTVARQLDVAGSELRRAAELGRPEGITPSDIQDVITFKDANGNVVGTAPSVHYLLGVDYTGGDVIEIYLKQVPGTTDQFKVEMITTAAQ